MISWVQGVVTATDSGTTALRNRLHLLATTSDSVTLISDSTVCRRARAVYAGLVGSDTTRTPVVYTIKVGALRYFVGDRKLYGGRQIDFSAVTDTSFVVLGVAAN
jgi:hypothetical protein